MIESIKGIHETVNFTTGQECRLYHNADPENFSFHWHTSLELIMPVENDYAILVGDDRYVLQVGDIGIINSCVIHALAAPEKGCRIIAMFNVARLYEYKEFETLLAMLKPVICIRRRPDLPSNQLIYEKLQRIVQEYDAASTFWEPVVHACFLDIFAELGRSELYRDTATGRVSSAKRHEYVESVMDVCTYINTHCTENLTLEGVAKISGFSKYHFTRLFKTYIGTTFYDYLSAKRIRRAETLLSDQELSITDIALSSGFASLSSFNRTFKTMADCTPSEYRKRLSVKRLPTTSQLMEM